MSGLTKTYIDAKINRRRVMVFSKATDADSAKVKQIFGEYSLSTGKNSNFSSTIRFDSFSFAQSISNASTSTNGRTVGRLKIIFATWRWPTGVRWEQHCSFASPRLPIDIFRVRTFSSINSTLARYSNWTFRIRMAHWKAFWRHKMNWNKKKDRHRSEREQDQHSLTSRPSSLINSNRSRTIELLFFFNFLLRRKQTKTMKRKEKIDCHSRSCARTIEFSGEQPLSSLRFYGLAFFSSLALKVFF